MKRGSSSIAGYALLVVAGCSLCFKSSRPEELESERLPIGHGSMPAKASDRSRISGDLAGRGGSRSAKECEAAIRDWLDSLAEHPENLKTPPIEACSALSAAATERFLRDPNFGWAPLLDISRYAYLTHWKALLPFHSALLARWGELDLADGLLHVTPPKDEDAAAILVWSLFDQAAKNDPAMAFESLSQWAGVDPKSPTYHQTMERTMEAWASFDPEGSWQWLARTDPDSVGWPDASRGYVDGLDHPDWAALQQKAVELPGRSGADLNSEIIKRWGLEDPIAALQGFAAYNRSPAAIRHGMQAVVEQRSPEGFSYEGLIAQWMTADPSIAERLESWQPGNLNTDEIFIAIANNGGQSAKVREQARGLIKDQEAAARLPTANERGELTIGPGIIEWSE